MAALRLDLREAILAYLKDAATHLLQCLHMLNLVMTEDLNPSFPEVKPSTLVFLSI